MSTSTEIRNLAAQRHPSTGGVLKFFVADHLPEGPIRKASEACAELALDMVCLPDSPELTVALRKLLEAKDAYVRATVEEHGASRPAAFSSPRGH